MPNMNALSLRIKKVMANVKKVMANVKVCENRSKVKVKVTHSKFMVPLERPCHKEHTCQIRKLYVTG